MVYRDQYGKITFNIWTKINFFSLVIEVTNNDFFTERDFLRFSFLNFFVRKFLYQSYICIKVSDEEFLRLDF